MQIPDAAIGSIVAAIIAGVVVFISTVLSKEQKTSEFRQVWIDELRKDVAQYVSGTIEFTALYAVKKKLKVGEVEFLEENFDAIRELQALEYRIILRLNPVKHASLVAKIKALREGMGSIYQQGLNNKVLEAALTDAITDDCKKILKSEWERVKRGEPAFRFVKWAAIGIAAALGLFMLFYLLFRSPSRIVAEPSRTVAAQTTGPTPPQTMISNGSQSLHVSITAPVTPPPAANRPIMNIGPKPKPRIDVPVMTVPPVCSEAVVKCIATP
jgi:hypothetical protein